MDMIFNEQQIEQKLTEHEQLMEQEKQYIVNPSSYADELADWIECGGAQSGKSLPWGDVDIQRLRGGELSLWTGINGHGKSLLLGQVMLWRMSDQKCLIASFEMKPKLTLGRMVNQYAGCIASSQFARKALEEFNGRLWIYDQLGSVNPKRVLALVHFAAEELGIDHIVIDSLSKCGLGYDNYNKEMEFIDKLQSIIKPTNTHVHLVCHMRKGGNENEQLDKLDIRGSAALVDLADNAYIVQRNKPREAVVEKINKGSLSVEMLNEHERKLMDMPGVFFRVVKNRNGGKEGTVGLFYHEQSGQFVRVDNGRAMIKPF